MNTARRWHMAEIKAIADGRDGTRWEQALFAFLV
jgi:hypothetical protein